jgi:hypothetical protein
MKTAPALGVTAAIALAGCGVEAAQVDGPAGEAGATDA